MTRVVLDAAHTAKLAGGVGGAELVDEQGNLIGHFLSPSAYDRFVEVLFPPVTDQEVADARREMAVSGGVDGKDLLARLERITGPAGGRS